MKIGTSKPPVPLFFKYYIDPGHGWVAVKKHILDELNISHKITRFSFIKGDTVYLEEDMDANTFVKAYQEKFGRKPELETKNINRRSMIRSYDSYPQTEVKDGSL